MHNKNIDIVTLSPTHRCWIRDCFIYEILYSYIWIYGYVKATISHMWVGLVHTESV